MAEVGGGEGPSRSTSGGGEGPKPGRRLTAEELRRFEEDGFVIVENFLDVTADLKPILDEVEEAVEEVASRLLALDKISSKHEGKDVFSRLTAIAGEYPLAPVLLHSRGTMGPHLARLWTDPRLLDVVEQVLPAPASSDDSLAGHPVWNLRPKSPGNNLATVPWHQDPAYLAVGSETTPMPTCWIPLCDVNKAMGTLRVIRGGHRKCGGKLLQHHLERNRRSGASHSAQSTADPRSWYIYIKDEDLPEGERVDLELKAGGFVLFHSLLPHCSGDNNTDKIRWSVDLRWQRASMPWGFEAIKPLLPMRSADGRPLLDGTGQEWSSWNGINRNDVQKQVVAATSASEDDGPVISGPWIERWSNGM